MSKPTLYAIHYSPWSQRAVWALEHHGVDVHYQEHIPYLGELFLRRRARAGGFQGQVTAPMLVCSDGVLCDSWDILCYADRVGRGPSLQTTEPEIAGWAPRLEPAYDAARRRVTKGTLASNAALTEAAAAVVPRALAGMSRPVAAMGARFIAKKYRFDLGEEDHNALLIAGLEEIRARLGDGPFLYDSFSAADMIAASLLTAVRPHADASLGPATRAVWTDEALAAQFPDLLEWRDALRARPSGVPAA